MHSASSGHRESARTRSNVSFKPSATTADVPAFKSNGCPRGRLGCDGCAAHPKARLEHHMSATAAVSSLTRNIGSRGQTSARGSVSFSESLFESGFGFVNHLCPLPRLQRERAGTHVGP